MEPTAAGERIVLLDVLRGFAVFGMFTVNMTTDLPWGSALREQPLDTADSTVMILIDLLTNGKFVTIFSFLFGVGFFLQLERARGRGVPFLAVYLRRLVALFFIAALAIVAGLDAGILITYSIFGLVLLLFSRRSARFLLVAAVVCFVMGAVFPYMEAVSDLISTEQPERIELVDDRSSPEALAENERDRVYREGTFREIASHRASSLLESLPSWKVWAWDVPLLGLMLLSCYVCRRGALRDPAVRMKMARTALPWLLSIGAAGMVIFVWLHPRSNPGSDLLKLIGEFAFWPIGALVLGLGYAAIITLLWEKERCRRALLLFAPVGRLALTNYLFHALVIAVFTYQWGLGLYGEMGPFWGLMVVFAIFPLMIIASSWWIGRFQFGPIEWLWRTLTYGQIQSFRRASKPGV
ncbi:MAG: DUF418 domain-containing protein [Acidiferrobacterales bacterium]